jgi:hypothetical protein
MLHMAVLAARLPMPGEHARRMLAASLWRISPGCLLVPLLLATSRNFSKGSTSTSNIVFQFSWAEFRAGCPLAARLASHQHSGPPFEGDFRLNMGPYQRPRALAAPKKPPRGATGSASESLIESSSVFAR